MTPSENLAEKPFSESEDPPPFSEPLLEACVVARPLRRAPNLLSLVLGQGVENPSNLQCREVVCASFSAWP